MHQQRGRDTIKPRYDVEDLKRLRQSAGIVHPRFGDLNKKSAVAISTPKTHTHNYIERPFSFIHLSVTARCNARCAGCINGLSFGDVGQSLPTIEAPVSDADPERDAEAIIKLLPGMEKDVVVCLYGGEPLLVMDKVERLYELLSGRDLPFDIRFMLYTNGTLLDKAIGKHRRLMSRIWLYSLSIDGKAGQHDSVRPGADLETIHKNLVLLKEVRKGPLLMWSTLREDQSLLDCFEEFSDLHGEGLADHFFWHWVETPEPFPDFEDYLTRYEKDLRQVMDAYTVALSEGKLLSIVHINELVLYLLTGKKRNTTGCGVEVDRNFDIVSGKIYACADLPISEPIGVIAEDGTPKLGEFDLTRFTSYKNDLECLRCGVHAYCGGRCPVQALVSGAERLNQYCQLMRLHVGVVRDYIQQIADLMAEKNITAQDIYDRSAFFAQFTDVTP